MCLNVLLDEEQIRHHPLHAGSPGLSKLLSLCNMGYRNVGDHRTACPYRCCFCLADIPCASDGTFFHSSECKGFFKSMADLQTTGRPRSPMLRSDQACTEKEDNSSIVHLFLHRMRPGKRHSHPQLVCRSSSVSALWSAARRRVLYSLPSTMTPPTRIPRSPHPERGHRLVISDSSKYLPVTQFKMPSAFGFTELKKGYFSHFFNMEQNRNYVGPYPTASFYNPDDMTTAELTKFWPGNSGKHFTSKRNSSLLCVRRRHFPVVLCPV